ncbi:hypothetical protein FHY29_004004 [Xanthomonas arboricola]|uniref:hypothetical protein n=1 Tax=Xanthomonas arboricola TaxID=56448 RepID=UPI0011B021F4|nr:hypothetical protein [Xanthomonas arboricola]
MLVNAWGARAYLDQEDVARCWCFGFYQAMTPGPVRIFHRMLLLVAEPADLLHCSILTVTNALRASL